MSEHDHKIGDVMPRSHPNAGWIYMGPDEETGEDFFAAPTDESGTLSFNQAARRAQEMNAKVPTKSQLEKMYQYKSNGALKGTFNETGSLPGGLYWSSRHSSDYDTWVQPFGVVGIQTVIHSEKTASLRLVR